RQRSRRRVHRRGDGARTGIWLAPRSPTEPIAIHGDAEAHRHLVAVGPEIGHAERGPLGIDRPQSRRKSIGKRLDRRAPQTLPRDTNWSHPRPGLFFIPDFERPLPAPAANLKPSCQHVTIPKEIFATLGPMLPGVALRHQSAIRAGATTARSIG